MEADFSPQPHEEAAAAIEGKPVVSREVFDGLLPELRGRAFTITGIAGADVMQRVRDGIAGLPRGSVWDDVKGDVVKELEPFLGDGSEQRAELLLRTHGFQAFQASNWRVAQEDSDTTHLQYLATEDTHVRASHLALNGIVLPKDDEFWSKHYPPWEWGCRCRCRPMNPDMVDETKAEDAKRPPDGKLVIEGAAARKLNDGTLIRDGQTYNVSPPSETNKENAFQWHPDDLRLPVEEIMARYDKPVAEAFREWAGKTVLQEGTEGTESVWDWLTKKPAVAPSYGGQAVPVPVPAPVPASVPMGAPVSGALTIQRGQAAGLHATLKVIDSVHGDGVLPPIPVDGRPSRGSLGTFWGKRVSVKRDPTEALNFTHELGHFLDYFGLGAHGTVASEAHPDLQGWRDAINGSKLAADIKQARTMALTGGAQRYLRYLGSWKEMWARSYSQFVAEVSQDSAMLQTVANRVGPSWGHWDAADFKPIKDEIEKLFRLKGWMG